MEAIRRRSGRPPFKNRDKVRSELLRILLTKHEMAALSDFARQAQVEKNEVARWAITHFLAAVDIVAPNDPEAPC